MRILFGQKLLFGMLFLCLLWPGFSQAQEGFYLHIGPAGLFQLGGNNRDFRPGAGVQTTFGYNWESLGLRGRALVTSWDDDFPSGGVDEGVEMVLFGVDLKLFLLAFAGYSDLPFKPYLLAGTGAYFLTEGSNEIDNDNASGIGGNLGIGFDWLILEALSVGLENDYHFVGLIEDNTSSFGSTGDNGFGLFFTSLVGKLTFHF